MTSLCISTNYSPKTLEPRYFQFGRSKSVGELDRGVFDCSRYTAVFRVFLATLFAGLDHFFQHDSRTPQHSHRICAPRSRHLTSPSGAPT